MRNFTKLGFAAIIAAMLAVTGCTSGTPITPTPTPMPPETSTPTPAPEPVDPNHVITLGADAVVIESGDSSVAYSLSAPPTSLVADLIDIFGTQPTSSYSGDETCWYQMTTLEWAELRLSYSKQDINTTEFWTAVTINNDHDDTVRVVSPSGATIGDPLNALLERTPSELWYENTFDGIPVYYILDEQSAENPISPDNFVEGMQMDAYGTMVFGSGGIITSIVTPTSLHGDC